jgi:hypothetical protein
MKPLSSLTCYALTIRVRLAEPELHSLLAAATKVAQASQTGVYSCCTFRHFVRRNLNGANLIQSIGQGLPVQKPKASI